MYNLLQPRVFGLINRAVVDLPAAVQFLHGQCASRDWNYARICFHADNESTLMSMLIVVVHKFSYPAHRHSWKDESYVIVNGSADYLELDDADESVIFRQHMNEGSFFINNAKRFHCFKPHTDLFAFVEHTTGPFRGQPVEFMDQK